MDTLPTLFIPHGAGPCFFMDWTRGPADTWDRTAAWMRELINSIGRRPKQILVVSGHWEQRLFSVTSGAKPPLVYDYGGFPEHTYKLRWDAPGSPELAGRVQDLLAAARIPTAADPERGFDHGVFVPFKLIVPDADIPTVQLSMKAGLDPAEHLAVGRALAPLRDEGVLIVGSGMSWHNMRGFTPRFTEASMVFDDWLKAAIADPAWRDDRLAHWEAAPFGRDAHPREEHLIPLLVAAGAAEGEPGATVFTDRVMDVAISAFAFGRMAETSFSNAEKDSVPA
jgi:aromatic ring-opening dioxygenase catalytic subunit (LigB family)